MCPVRVQRASQRVEFFELAALFFIQWMAVAAWMVPLTLVLNAHGYQVIQPFAFATQALGAVVSPLFFGAMADRHMAPTRVLRRLSLLSAISLGLASGAVQWGWNPWLVLALIQVYSLCMSPLVSISTAIAMSTMRDASREFGPVRAMGTIGWMAGCWLVSLLGADTSTLTGFAGAVLWLALAGFTYFLPQVEPLKSDTRLTWHERLGLDALTLLKNSDHRVVFLSACLLNIPLAAFYPYTPPHLNDLGLRHPTGWMSLAQTTEIAAMFTLGALLARWRLKWILLAGLVLALLRYAFFAMDSKSWILAGIMLHGGVYTLFFTTAQIYVNDRVDVAWRTRAQALLTLMTGGVGYFIGYLGCGWWFNSCAKNGATHWPQFWGVLTIAVAMVMGYFLFAYHGVGRGFRRRTEDGAAERN